MAYAKKYDLARMTSATTGTGTLTLGSAVTGWLTFALAGIADGDIVRYAIIDPGTSNTASEIGIGTYTASGTTLARTTVQHSTNSNAAINCSGNQHVVISAGAEDFPVYGTASLNFGSWPGSAVATLAVTGIPGILSTSVVDVFVQAAATAEHTIEEHIIDGLSVMGASIVAGTGFTIYGTPSRGGVLFGHYNIGWSVMI